MERARVKKGGGRARFPLWEENPWELWVGIIRGLSMWIITEDYPWIINGNYHWELSVGIIRENYHLVYQWRRTVEIYRNTGVSKKCHFLYIFHLAFKEEFFRWCWINEKIVASGLVFNKHVYYKCTNSN